MVAHANADKVRVQRVTTERATHGISSSVCVDMQMASNEIHPFEPNFEILRILESCPLSFIITYSKFEILIVG